MSHAITILAHDPRWRGLAPTARRAAEAVLGEIPPPLGGRLGGGRSKARSLPHSGPTPALPLRGREVLAITLVLSNDAEVQALNHQFRAKNKPTNVLSFPEGSVVDGVVQLGDIILAYETIAAEAAAQGKTLKHHLSHLVIHGVLHLLGYDHLTKSDEKRMEAIEITILARMGIANPYESA